MQSANKVVDVGSRLEFVSDVVLRRVEGVFMGVRAPGVGSSC